MLAKGDKRGYQRASRRVRQAVNVPGGKTV